MRTVIFGVDGLTFRVLKPLMERGALPHFQKLASQGCQAILESKYPPLTPPAWISLSTGLKPAGHGVYDFWEYEEKQGEEAERSARVLTHRKGGKAIWNILSEYGKRVLVVNVPMTYPPEPVNGIMVSGYMTPSTDVEFTYPPSFKRELFQAVPHYEIDMENRQVFSGKVAERSGRLIDTVLRMTEKRIALLRHLFEKEAWDFCYAAFVGPDRLQHSLWDEVSGLDAETNRYFALLDDALGLVLEQLGPEDALFVVSDHGFHGASRLFDVNEYLHSKGLLVLRSHEQRDRARQKAAAKRLLQKTGLFLLARRAKLALEDAGVLKKRYNGVKKPLLSDLDWDKTMAYAPSHSGFPSGFANIFFHPGFPAESIAELGEDLKKQRDPLTGKPLIDAIYTAEAFGEGPFAPQEPHLLLLPNEGITFRMDLGNRWLWDNATTSRNAKKKFGVHHKDGVLFAYGGGLKRGFVAPHAEIYDLVPTVLYSMGLQLPGKFDGRVLHHLFIEKEGDAAASTESEGDVESRLVRRKLRNLLEV